MFPRLRHIFSLERKIAMLHLMQAMQHDKFCKMSKNVTEVMVATMFGL